MLKNNTYHHTVYLPIHSCEIRSVMFMQLVTFPRNRKSLNSFCEC